MYYQSLALLLLYLVNLLNSGQTTPLVQLKNGLLSGQDHEYYTAFRSIPYAQPPVGERRFESPQAYNTQWPSVREAVAIAPKCLQYNVLNPDDPLEGNEDCLYLNVFVPKRSINSTSAAMPVMVFIHGGGFMWGSSDFYGEQYIMREGHLILVTFNYRLGPFGFLSTEDTEIPGNMGLKDQAFALQWVYENIRNFGGDPEKILLAGWSAGAASVHYHLVSAATSPAWFKSAVSFSGTALCPCHHIYKGQALKKSQLLGSYMNCSDLRNTTELKKCLKSKKAVDIVGSLPRFYEFSNHPFAIFGPVIDGSFLTDHVANLMRSGHRKQKPWLVARTAEDGAFGTAEFLQKSPDSERLLIDDLNENWLQWAPIMLFFNASLTRNEREKQAVDLRRRYFGHHPIGLGTYKILQDLFNTEMSTKHVQESVELFVNFTTASECYGYVYDNAPDFGLSHMASGSEDVKFGTAHGDDLFLIFNTTVRRNHALRVDEVKISKSLIEMLRRFASTGTPQYDGQTLRKLQPTNNFQFNVITKDGMV